jgi:HNH endonuclease
MAALEVNCLTSMDKNFTIEQMKAALLTVRSKISEPQMSMLRAHYLYRTLSMERIATFGGYGEYRAGNLQYGVLCGRIAEQLGFVHRSKTYTIASGEENDSEGHFQWQMDDVVVTALGELRWFPPSSEPAKSVIPSESPQETEREALIKARVGQGNFRTDVIALWGSCAVTGCSLSTILVASHLVPWAACATNQERLDPFNGLLLTPNLDRLVDRLLIAFNDDGSILLSKELMADELAILGVTERSKLRFVRPAMLPYLQRHRELFRAQV